MSNHKTHLFLMLLFAVAGNLLAADPWKGVTIKDYYGNALWDVSDAHCVPEEFPFDHRCKFSVVAKNVSGVAIPGPWLRAKVEQGGDFSLSCYRPEQVHDMWRLKAPGETVECRGEAFYYGKIQPLVVREITRESSSWKSPAEAAAEKSLADAAKAAADETRAACAKLFRQTADKPVGDLTVRESQQIGYCTSRGRYHE